MEYTYPKGEIVWVGYCDKDSNLKYIITSKQTRDYYYLYELKDQKFVKLGRDRNPRVLEDKYIDL